MAVNLLLDLDILSCMETGIDQHDDSALVAQLTECQVPLGLYVRSLMPGDHSAGDVVQQANAKIWELRADILRLEAELSVDPIFASSITSGSNSIEVVDLGTEFTIDAEESGSSIQVVDGEPVSTEAIPEEWLVDSIKIGAASICNWSEPLYRTDPNFVVRNFIASMDEFALFSGALSASEILDLFETGNPNEP